jgi:NAD-dependent deacetylase
VDNLHRKAGVPADKIFELHGNVLWAVCLSCGQRYPFEAVKARIDGGEEIPDCAACGGMLKPDAVLFGEALPEAVLAEASRRSSESDLFIVVGSTLIVYPAAYMPAYALRAGAKLIIVNLSDTPLDIRASVLIRAKAGEAMTNIVGRVRQEITG